MAAKSSKGLGKGFDVLIPKDFDSSLLVDESERVQKLFINAVLPNKDQPRKHFDEVSLKELAESIREHGILQPLVVTPRGGENFMLIAGERRWRAAQLAGLQTVPAIVRSAQELEQLEIALVENVQRVDLNPLEQAASIQRLHDQFTMGYEDIAKRLGKALPTISNMVRLLQLSPSAQEALKEGRISEGHARAILALKAHPEKQEELLLLIQKNHWSVRQAEQFVVAHKTGARTTQAAHKRLATTTPATEKLSAQFKAPVSLRRTAKGGRLEIGFKTEADLKRILNRLSRK